MTFVQECSFSLAEKFHICDTGMIETEQNLCAKDGKQSEREKNFHEYAIITEGLLQDFQECKGEQMRCRAELATLLRETKRAAEVARESFSHASTEKCIGNENYEESLGNLQKRISILEMEKETVFQMWQMTLKTVDVLEEELKSTQHDGRASKYYEEQINGIKEMYSEAIKALESKLLRAKENFAKNQALWESNREKIEILNREKNDLGRKFTMLENEARAKEESNVRLIESLKSEVKQSRNELEKARDEKLELHEKVQEARSFATKALAKSEESKRKVSEALEIAETAIREKEMAVQRESRAMEERARLESRLNVIVEEYTTRLDRELAAARESFDRGSKKSALEIKELKIELREKVTLLDRLERENKLLENELDKVRHTSEEFVQRSSANVLDLEEKLKEAHSKIEACEENCRRKYEEKIRESDARITELEVRLEATGDRLRRTQLYSNKEFDERIREADIRTKEILERYSALERRLARTMDEKEHLVCEIQTLRADYDREIARRDNERRSQEARIRELQDNLQIANNSLEKSSARGVCLAKQIENLQQEWQEKQSVGSSGNEMRLNGELMRRLKTLQDKYDQRTKELTHHVETHQKLCQRWKDEAKSLTHKFQARAREFREKIGILRKENEELNKELLVCRQQLANCRLQLLNRYDQGDGAR